MKAILFDLDGVFYEGNKVIAGAASVVDWVKQDNIPHLFLTNTTSKPRSALVEKLADFGIKTDELHILTPPVAAISWLQKKASTRIALFVPRSTQSEFERFELVEQGDAEDLDAVVIGDLGEQWDYPTINRAFRLLMHEPKPELIALGMTRYWKAEDGLRLDVAPFVVALQYASNVTPTVMGKPSKAFYQVALDTLKVEAEQTMMVGDDIHGDIEGAQQAGLKTVFVRTGKFRPEDLTQGINPDFVLDSVCSLPDCWCEF